MQYSHKMNSTSRLQDKFQALGADMMDYEGWLIPRSFSSLESEYTAATRFGGLVERPYLGLIRLSGDDHQDLLHRLTTNELRNLAPGKGQINIFTDKDGRILDRVMLFKTKKNIFLLCSPQKAKLISDWIEKFIFIENVKIENLSAQYSTITVLGSLAEKILQAAFDLKAPSPLPWNFYKTEFQNKTVLIQKSKAFHPLSYNVVFDNAISASLWERLMEYGSDFGLKPIGFNCLESIRIESGWPASNPDFHQKTNPHEAGMGDYIDYNKGCYIGQEVIARLDTYHKIQKHLVGLQIFDDERPLPHSPIFLENREVGYTTSCSFSPLLKCNIALGYVKTKFIEEGLRCEVQSADRLISAKIVNLPFTTV